MVSENPSLNKRKNSSSFTFIYIRGKASDKDLPGVALHPLSILTAGWGVQAGGQGGVTVAIVEETIFKGKKTGTTWAERKREEYQEDRQGKQGRTER